MSGFSSEPTEIERIALAASDWIVRCDRGFSAQEQAEFSTWLAADPRHREWLELRRTAWAELAILEDLRPEQGAEPDPDLLARAPVRRLGQKLIFPAVLATAAAVALVFALHRTTSIPVGPAVCETRTLEDGSVIELRPGAKLEIHFTPAERRVRLLSGEARFQVAKNRQRPFLVETQGVAIRDLGTEFDIRSGEKSVDLLVTEGRVSLSSPHVAAVEVSAGHSTSVAIDRPAPATVVTASADEMDQWLGWAPKLLDFNARPLGEVAAEFNRVNRIQIAVADPTLANLPISASFRSDNPQGFVRMLELSTGVRVERKGDVMVLQPKAVSEPVSR